MRKALPAIALTLAAVSAAHGQDRPGDCAGALKGPVRSVRVVRAVYSSAGGRSVEGARRLVSVTVYSEDRRRSEETRYDEAGKVRHIFVRACYDDGRAAENTLFDAERRPLRRVVFSRDGGELVRLDAAGQVVRREVFARDAEGRQTVTAYDGAGVLVYHSVSGLDGGKSVATGYDGEGRLTGRSVGGAVGGGLYQRDDYRYSPDGTVATHSTVMSDAGKGLRRWEADGLRQEERREYDRRGNLRKVARYVQHPVTGAMVQSSTYYYEITYF